MNFEFIVYDREPDDIGILTINRPKVLNALNWQTLRELREFLEDVLHRENLKSLIVTGAGDRAFVAGADIAEMYNMEDREFQEYVDFAHKVYELVEAFQVRASPQ